MADFADLLSDYASRDPRAAADWIAREILPPVLRFYAWEQAESGHSSSRAQFFRVAADSLAAEGYGVVPAWRYGVGLSSFPTDLLGVVFLLANQGPGTASLLAREIPALLKRVTPAVLRELGPGWEAALRERAP